MEIPEKLTPEQVANFVYWIQETHDLRGIKSFDKRPTSFLKPTSKMAYIEVTLLAVFFDKYPDGLLTGWRADVPTPPET